MNETALFIEADLQKQGREQRAEEIAAIMAQLRTELDDLRKLLRVHAQTTARAASSS